VSSNAADAILKAFYPASKFPLPCYKTIRNRNRENLPEIVIEAFFEDLNDGSIVKVGPVKSIPEKKYPKSRYRLILERTYIKVIYNVKCV